MAAKKVSEGRRGEHPPPEGKVRQSQAITTYGPGSMVDLLHDAVLVGGLDFWGRSGRLAFDEPRLRARLARRFPELRATEPFVLPPAGEDRSPSRRCGVQVLEFPRWFVCQNVKCRTLTQLGPGAETRAGRYVHEECSGEETSYFVPVRFVAACLQGHIQDIPWRTFARHRAGCESRTLQLMEGRTGDFAELEVVCTSCNARRALIDATVNGALGGCDGHQPWLNRRDPEGCSQKLRLLLRTATGSYFAQVESSLAIPLPKTVRSAVEEHWDILGSATPETLPAFRHIPRIEKAIAAFSNEEVLRARADKIEGRHERLDAPRTAEFKQFVAAEPERVGDYPGPDDEFFVRRASTKDALPSGIARVVLAHRLREVRVQTGFTRFSASVPDLQGEHPDAKAAPLGSRVTWLPGVQVRGEGIFLELDEAVVCRWEDSDAVKRRVATLYGGYEAWAEAWRKRNKGPVAKEPPPFFGARFYLLHSLAHLLIEALSLECGYSASAIRERIYCASRTDPQPMAALLLSTGTTGSEGTLGGLLEQGRVIGQHLRRAYDLGVLCSNDPVCSAHDPAHDPTERWLEGAACHGCLFIAEPSCERFNNFLDRTLVFPTLGSEGAAFFSARP